MSLNNLEDLFVHELKDVLHAEKQIVKALPKLAKAAASDSLKEAFEAHLEETKAQIARLEEIFALINKPSRAKRCVGMEGLIEEGSELIAEEPDEAVLDAGLIASAQKVEHYEICAYGTLATYARQLGLSRAEALLEETLAEEKQADKKLSELANEINLVAEHTEV